MELKLKEINQNSENNLQCSMIKMNQELSFLEDGLKIG